MKVAVQEQNRAAAASVRVNTFSGIKLDRASERRDDRLWVEGLEREPTTRFLVLDAAGEIFIDDTAQAPYWVPPEARESLLGDVPATLLGLSDDGAAWFMLAVDEMHGDRLTEALAAKRMGLRQAGMIFSAFDAGLFAYAKGVSHWQRETRHCARCGSPVLLVASGHRAQCTNSECGRLHFPRTDAAIIVIVEHEGACLLGRQRGWPAGRYSTLAGFIEPGESLEDAVRREVAEESGVEVIDCHYHSSQPWPLPASLMVGFTATARSRAINLRDKELEDARWFTPQQIVDGMADGSLLVSPSLSVSYQLLQYWLHERAGLDLDELVAANSH
jgi:NAD+ diphosphatase